MLFYNDEEKDKILSEGDGGFDMGAPEGDDAGDAPPEGETTDDNPPDDDTGGDDAGGDTPGLDDAAEGGDDAGGKPVDDIEAQKKVTLFGEFEELTSTSDELTSVIKQYTISNTALDEKLKEVLNAMTDTLNDTKEKLRNIMVNQFSSTDYKALLYLYLTLKATVLTVSDLANKTIRNKS